MFYFSDTIPAEALVRRQNALQPSAFIPTWRSLPEANESVQTIQLGYKSVESAVLALSQHFQLQVDCLTAIIGDGHAVRLRQASCKAVTSWPSHTFS